MTQSHLLSRASVAGLALLLLSTSDLPGQRRKRFDVHRDPYTQNDKAAMQQAGYKSFGPFVWTNSHNTRGIRKRMPKLQFIFVETKHFKIGSTLPAYRLPKDPKKRKKIQTDLKALKAFLPRVKPKTRVLDRWQRLHLYAYRLESLYSSIQKTLGVSDADFPKTQLEVKPASAKRDANGGSEGDGSSNGEGTVAEKAPEFMGYGPYLGMQHKFLVLLFNDESNLDRYTRFANNTQTPKHRAPILNFSNYGALFLGMHTGLCHGWCRVDSELHSLMVFSATGMLLDGYKNFLYRIPAWLREGFSNYMARELNPDARYFVAIRDHDEREKDKTFWPGAMRRLAKYEDFKPASEFFTWQHANKFELMDHIAAWSRIEFLLQDPKKFASFFNQFKTRLPSPPMQLPSWESVVQHQWRVLKKTYGYDAKAFDEAWIRHVVKTYPKKRNRRQ